MLNYLGNNVSLCLKILGCLAASVCWFNPAAGASLDQLSSGADLLGAGIFPASFYFIFIVDRFGGAMA
jgi:uncharacterized membrane protein HdeD (DUF308 family)